MTVDETLYLECHSAALAAIDRVMTKRCGRHTFVRDRVLPRLIPAINAAIDDALKGDA